MKSIVKTAMLSSLGAGLEYYDFVIYAMLASVLGGLFFPAAQAGVATVNTFAVFALGYLARPLGGLIFGTLGDRFGRKQSFVLSILTMAASTTAIGLLPTYHDVGIAASIGLVACRLIQGISFGAEMPGAITFISEHSASQNQSRNTSWVFTGIACGTTLASFVNTVLHHTFTEAAIAQYAWRIPFLLGGLLAIVGFFLRRETAETPEFKRSKAHDSNLALWLDLLKHHKSSWLIGTTITLLAGCYIIFFLFLPTYLPVHYGYSKADVSLAMTIAMAWAIVCLPVGGWIADRIGPWPMYTATILTAILMTMFCMPLLNSHQRFGLFTFMLTYQTFVALMATSYPTILARAFPTQVRYSGVALSYNIAFALAGFTPLLASMVLLPH